MTATAATTWQDEIRAIEEENRVAFLAVDIPALDRMWTDDCAINSPINRINTKTELFGLLRAGIVRHTDMQIEIERIDRHGDIVIVMGNDQVVDPPDGTISHRRYTNVWKQVDGKWLLIARHAHVVSRGAPGE